MQNKDWNIAQDPIFDKLNEITVGKLDAIEGAKNGGFSTKGRKASPEESKRRSEAQKGLKLGIKQNPETVKKRSESLKGKNVGKVRTEETKEKYRKAKLGKKQSDETKEKRTQVILNKPYATYNNKEFSLTELSLELNLTKKYISKIRSKARKDEWGIIFL